MRDRQPQGTLAQGGSGGGADLDLVCRLAVKAFVLTVTAPWKMDLTNTVLGTEFCNYSDTLRDWQECH